MKLAVCRRRSERLGFSVVVGLLLESMINIYTSLLKVCGGNLAICWRRSERVEIVAVWWFLLESMSQFYCFTLSNHVACFHTCELFAKY